MSGIKKKSISILLAILFAYISLVATHKGEFWPFSIYPMFSQAGNPWTRSLVRDITQELHPIESTIQTKDEIYGVPFVLNSIGVHQNDLSNFLSKNKEWTPTKKQAIRTYFKNELNTKKIIIYKVRGELDSGSAAVTYKPFIYLTADTTIVYK